MKRKSVYVTLVAAMLVSFAGYNVYQAQRTEEISEVTLANVEALASGNEDDEDPMCPNGCIDGGSGCLCHYWFPTYAEYEKW